MGLFVPFVNQFNHTSCIVVIIPTYRPKSVLNLFNGVLWPFCLVSLHFWIFFWYMDFCHRVISLRLFLIKYSRAYEVTFGLFSIFNFRAGICSLFCGVVCVVTLSFWHFCWCWGFCHRTGSDLLLFVMIYLFHNRLCKCILSNDNRNKIKLLRFMKIYFYREWLNIKKKNYVIHSPVSNIFNTFPNYQLSMIITCILF